MPPVADEGAGRARALGHLAEGPELRGIGGVVRLIGAGEVAHDERERPGLGPGARSGPVGGLHPQPVHAAVELDAIGRLGQGRAVAGELLGAVEHGRQARVADRVASPAMWPEKTLISGPGAEGLAQGYAFLGHGDEEAARARLRPGGRDRPAPRP
jgi:hypothetical protein